MSRAKKRRSRAIAREAARNTAVQSMEPLENRQMMSTVTVSAASNWMATVNSSQAGDTIKFAAGNYALNGATNLPARHYVGDSGATFTGTNQLNVSGSELTGFTFNGTYLNFSGSGTNVHDNSFVGSSIVNLTDTTSNSQLSHNSFSTTSNFPVRGYPGDNVTVEYNTAVLNTPTAAGAEGNQEWLHFISRCKGLTVSHNVITGGLMRWAVELQGGMTGLKVENNYIHATGGGGGISCATGGDPTGVHGNQGENIDISGNTLIADQRLGCALEIMGDENIQVHDNYFSGYGTAILNGTGGQQNQGLRTSNNTLIYAERPYSDGDSTPWSVPPRVSTGDHVYQVGSAGIPSAPSAAATVGASVQGAVSNPQPVTAPVSISPVSSTPAPTNLSSSSPSSSEIDLSWTDNSSHKATYVLQRKTTHGSDGFVTIATLGKGVTSYTDTTAIQGSWQYDYHLIAVQGGVNSAPIRVTAQASATPVVSSGSVSATATPNGPGNFSTTSPSSSEIDLKWTDTNHRSATYVVQRKSTHGTDGYVTIAPLPAGTTSYKDTTNVQASWEYDYLVTAVNNHGSSGSAYAHAEALLVGNLNPVTHTAAATPDVATPNPLNEADLGNEQSAGSSVLAKGVYRVSSGATQDTAKGTSHFVYEQASGNASIVAHVSSTSGGSNYGAAGISMRAGTTASNSSISMGVSSSGAITLVTANASGTTSEFDAGAASVGSGWLKLVRSGSTVTGYCSQDGASWHKVGSVTASLPDQLNVGLTVTSKADGAAGVALFKHVAIKSGAQASNVKATTTKTQDAVERKSSQKKSSVNGLTATIYDNARLSHKALTRIDADVNFNWGNATPDASVKSSPYSVKWTGMVEAPTSDTYTFVVHSDSGAKLWVDHKLVVANWHKTGAGDDSGTIHLRAGHKYHMRLEYAEPAAHDSAVSMLWSNSTQSLQVVPQANLFAVAA